MTKLPNFPLFLGSLLNWLHGNQSTKPKATCQVARPSALYLQVAWPWWVAHNTNVFPLIWGLRSRKTHQKREFYKPLVVVGIDVKGLQGILPTASGRKFWEHHKRSVKSNRIFNLHLHPWKLIWKPAGNQDLEDDYPFSKQVLFKGVFYFIRTCGLPRVSTCGHLPWGLVMVPAFRLPNFARPHGFPPFS